MSIEQFTRARQTGWQRLEELLPRLRGGRPRGLSADEVVAFGHLYRQATSDLAIAQRDYPYDRVTLYLNGLVARAHPQVYRSEAMDRARFSSFYHSTFPGAFRQALPFTAAALLCTLLPAVACFLLAVVRPSVAYVLLPGTAERLLPIVQQHRLWFNSIGGSDSLMSSLIMTNNIRVALIAFAGGALLGLPTIYILIFNGIMIGTLAGVVQYYGLSLGFWSFVVGHGVLELSVIFIAGGCGLQLGWAVVHPGLLRRIDACLAAGRRAMVLILGAVPLLVVAGLIEGFLSPSAAPALLKLGVGLLTGLLLYAYLLLGGRKEPAHATKRVESPAR
jgi:uncharacterized membrane protein SpoIIM required for sporulation